jgi:uncharacterized membrane protein
MEPDVEAQPQPGASWFFQPWAPAAVLAVCTALWAFVFFQLGALRHDRHSTFGFDLGIYDQATWLLAFFHDPFITVRGLDAFGHHLSPGLWLFAPLYWLGGGPKMLLLGQVLSQAAGAAAVFLLGRDLLRSRWLAAALGVVYLLHPTSQWLVWEFFHPEAFAIGPLLFAYWAARTQRWRWFWPAALLAVSMKEDLALALLLIGVLVAFRGARRIGLAIVAFSFGWFVLATRVVIPLRYARGPFYGEFFGELGDSPAQVAWNLVRDPGRTWSLATAPDRLEYYRVMFLPVLFLPFLAPQALAIGLPMLAVNVFTSAGHSFTRDYRYHYSAIVLVAVTVATVEAIAFVRNTRARRVLVGALLVSSLASTVAWGISPISLDYDRGYWPLHREANGAAKDAAIARLPGGAATSAAYNLVPHITHRERVYEFPEPWRRVNWGTVGDPLPDPAGVEYLLLDRALLDDDDATLLDELLAREFEVRYESDDIVLAERVEPP